MKVYKNKRKGHRFFICFNKVYKPPLHSAKQKETLTCWYYNVITVLPPATYQVAVLCDDVPNPTVNCLIFLHYSTMSVFCRWQVEKARLWRSMISIIWPGETKSGNESGEDPSHQKSDTGVSFVLICSISCPVIIIGDSCILSMFDNVGSSLLFYQKVELEKSNYKILLLFHFIWEMCA